MGSRERAPQSNDGKSCFNTVESPTQHIRILCLEVDCGVSAGPGSWRGAGRRAGSEVGDQVQGLGEEQAGELVLKLETMGQGLGEEEDGELVPKLESLEAGEVLTSLEDQLPKWVVSLEVQDEEEDEAFLGVSFLARFLVLYT